jgi:hypothetical protein
MTSLVQDIEEHILQQFRQIATDLSARYPNVKARVKSASSGSATTFQGHNIYIECSLADAQIDQEDSVSLSIGLCHLTTEPKINADVCWDYSGRIEASFYEDWWESADWPLATKETIDQLYQDIPRLIAVLEQAVKRGRPLEKNT